MNPSIQRRLADLNLLQRNLDSEDKNTEEDSRQISEYQNLLQGQKEKDTAKKSDTESMSHIYESLQTKQAQAQITKTINSSSKKTDLEMVEKELSKKAKSRKYGGIKSRVFDYLNPVVTKSSQSEACDTSHPLNGSESVALLNTSKDSKPLKEKKKVESLPKKIGEVEEFSF